MKTDGPAQSFNSADKNDRILSLMSLFESDFSIDWIAELSNCKTSILIKSLQELIRQGRLKKRRDGFYFIPEVKKKKLLHEFSTQERADIHKRIAEIILSDQIDEEVKARTVGYHLSQIQVDLTGCHWLKKAGDYFVRTFNNEAAIKCYLNAIDNLVHFDGTDADLLFIETALRFAKVSVAREPSSKVISILQSALQKAKRLKRTDLEALLMINIATDEHFLGQDRDAIKHFIEGRRLAETLEDTRALNKINLYETFLYFRQGRHKDIIKCYEKFVPEITKFPEDFYPLINMCIAGYSYGQIGAVTQGLGVLDALRLHTRSNKNYNMEAHALAAMGVLMLDLGKPEEALPHLKDALKLGIQHNNGWVRIECSISLAFCYYLMGQTRLSLEHLQKFFDFSAQVQIQLWPYPYLIMICWGMENGDLPPIDNLSLREEIQKSLRSQNVFLQGIAHRYLALLEKKGGASHMQVIRSLQRSLDLLRLSGNTIELAKTHLEMARQYLYSNQNALANEAALSAAEILIPLNRYLIPDDLKSLCEVGDQREKNLLKEILQLGRDIVTIRESRELVLQIISFVNRLTGAERGALFLKDADELRLKASKNISAEQISESGFSESMRIIEKVANEGIGLIKTVKREDVNAFGEDGIIRSIICVPMLLRDEVKGVLYHDNRLLSSAFTESDLNLLGFFAAIASVALDNVVAYEEIQEANQKLAEKKEYLEEQFLKKSMVNIIGESTAIKRVFKQIEQVANTNATVLITGDTGVGKELVACALHYNSNRKDNPFICVQCSSLPEKLLASELFGYEKGAFTGAAKRKLGRFELAKGGTLFLDEIGEISLDMQVQLLRVLQTKQFERVGSNETITLDFRLIAATNRNLKKEVEAGKFRRDLYYRLNVFPIHVPSLKERISDLPLLVGDFARMFSSQLGKPFERIAQEDVKNLLNYDWPGNVRELQNLVERAVIIHEGSILRLSGFLPRINQPNSAKEPRDDNFSLTDHQRQHIIHALEKTNWKVSGPRGAAKLLDLNPSTLVFRMKKLGIKRPL